MRYLRWFGRLLRFPFYYALLLMKSNMHVVRDIVTPGQAMRAGIGRVPVRSRTSLEFTLIANLVSVTPGTLTLAVQAEPPALYVHDMYVSDADELRAVVHDLETRLLGVLRPSGDVPAPPEVDNRLEDP